MQKKPLNTDKILWGEYEVPQEEPLQIEIGPLVVWCIRVKQELRAAWQYRAENNEENVEEFPNDDSWHRWAFKQEKPKIEIKPVFPDRPVVVKPENPFKIAEDASVRIYVRVPVWLRINLLGSPVSNLAEIPIITLSNTWFGSFQEGDLCYWVSSGARLEIEPDPVRPYMAICPLQLIDQSPEDLNVEKICLRTSNLSLFQDNSQLWSDETKIIYRGKTEVSEVHVSGRPPAEAQKASLLSAPREKSKKTFNFNTFSTFKELTGFGFFIKD